jgi:drug/metabolite transporter (DMT)-like permease
MIWGKRWFQFTVLMILAFIWGSSFILMKIGMKSFSSSQAAALRILMASMVLLPIAIKNIKTLKRKDVKSLLIVGFIGSFFPAFMFMEYETRIDSSMAGMLNSLTPVFTFIVGLLFHRTAFRWMQAVGLQWDWLAQ